MRRTVVSVLGGGIILSSCVWGGGCEDSKAVRQGAQSLTQRLRDDPTREGKVGAREGIRVWQHAMSAARQIARPTDARCWLAGGAGPGTVEISWSVEVRRPGYRPRRWRQRASVDRASDATAVTSEATFTDELGSQGEVVAAWVILGDSVYSSEDGERFAVSREPSPRRRAALVARITGGLQALIAAAPGWRYVGDHTWRMQGAQGLFCGPDAHEASARWLRRLAGRGTLRRAVLTVAPDGTERVYEGVWALKGGAQMTVAYTDRVVATRPPAIHIPEVAPERTPMTWSAVDAQLQGLVREGLVEVPASAEVPEESGRDGR